MKAGLGPVGPRGLVLLAATALVGVGLANHGFETAQGATTPGALGTTATATAPPGTTPAATASPTATPAAATPSAHGTTSPTAAPSSSPAPTSSPGPLLSSQSYAAYAFQIWPGTQSATAKAALTGLSVTVHRKSNGLSVTATVNGQSAGTPQFYPGGARVYIVEAALGDDSGGSDYSLSDDGLVVTDAGGRIVS